MWLSIGDNKRNLRMVWCCKGYREEFNWVVFNFYGYGNIGWGLRRVIE